MVVWPWRRLECFVAPCSHLRRMLRLQLLKARFLFRWMLAGQQILRRFMQYARDVKARRSALKIVQLRFVGAHTGAWSNRSCQGFGLPIIFKCRITTPGLEKQLRRCGRLLPCNDDGGCFFLALLRQSKDNLWSCLALFIQSGYSFTHLGHLIEREISVLGIQRALYNINICPEWFRRSTRRRFQKAIASLSHLWSVKAGCPQRQGPSGSQSQHAVQEQFVDLEPSSSEGFCVFFTLTVLNIMWSGMLSLCRWTWTRPEGLAMAI